MAVQRSFRQTSNLRHSWTSREANQEVLEQGQPDALVLHKSLVWEGVLPEGFDREFQEFYSGVSPAAERQRHTSAHFDNVAAAGWISEHKLQAEVREKARSGCSDGRETPEDFQEPPSTSPVRHTDSQARG